MRILFLDIDTLRADHLGCYGYGRSTSPNIDAIAERGVRFAEVHASDVPCLPSRTALTTGMFGIRNGVVNHGGVAADLASWGPDRGFMATHLLSSFAGTLFGLGHRTASISSFPFRHSAPWWTAGYESWSNPTRNMGIERADEVVPHALDWLDRNAHDPNWMLHVHLWDPHTPYNVPPEYGDPFAEDPVPSWYTDEVRQEHWELPGPHSAQEPFGLAPGEWGPPTSREPVALDSMHEAKRLFDGYDTGVRYADDAVGRLCSKLDDLGLLDDTAIFITSDHGEGLGELGIYADHGAADAATSHIPAILAWPGVAPQVQRGLHYHLDVTATIVELAGGAVPAHWDGCSSKVDVEAGRDAAGREFLVIGQGAWSCQRAVRTGDHLYLRTYHDGLHAAWADEMLFDLAADPHEQHDLAPSEGGRVAEARQLLDSWTKEQMARSLVAVDPLETTIREGGPLHVRGALGEYCERLRRTGRARWADVLESGDGGLRSHVA